MYNSLLESEPTYESPLGLSIYDLFAKLVAETRNEIIHKTDIETHSNINVTLVTSFLPN